MKIGKSEKKCSRIDGEVLKRLEKFLPTIGESVFKTAQRLGKDSGESVEMIRGKASKTQPSFGSWVFKRLVQRFKETKPQMLSLNDAFERRDIELRRLHVYSKDI